MRILVCLENRCYVDDINTSEILDNMKIFEKVLQTLIEQVVKDYKDAHGEEIHRCEIIGGNCHWVLFKEMILNIFEKLDIPMISFVIAKMSLNDTLMH